MHAGWALPGEHSEKQAAKELTGQIQGQDFFDPAQVPDGLNYVLFSREQLTDGSLCPGQRATDYSLYTGGYTGRIGADAWSGTDLRADVIILLFRYEVRALTSSFSAAMIRDLQACLCFHSTPFFAIAVYLLIAFQHLSGKSWFRH